MALLVAIVVAFAVRPLIGDGELAQVAFSLSIVGLMLIALYTVQYDEVANEPDGSRPQRRRWIRLGWVLAVFAIIERLALISDPTPRLLLIGSICWLIFFAFVTATELRAVLRQRAVTAETISMSISIYLLFALTWGLLYSVIYQFQPGAFSITSIPAGELFTTFMYFSLTTLSTIGFGDIAPLTMQSRYAAVAQGITGQFYLAILVARLVGMQMTQSSELRPPDRER
ncbi:MAG: ion channel [Proteobacteria bacterium]|nr:ion channel [Pseudomonadota bacterium]